MGVVQGSIIGKIYNIMAVKEPEYVMLMHTIACDKSKVIYNFDIVEGKYRPIVMGNKEFGEKGVTAGLMVRGTKYSGLCVLEGLTSMVDKVVLGLALIKKRRYWPKGFPAEEIL